MIADFETLQRLSKRERPSAVKKWLQKRGIPYSLNADDEPWTTERALNDHVLGSRKTEPNWPVGKQR